MREGARPVTATTAHLAPRHCCACLRETSMTKQMDQEGRGHKTARPRPLDGLHVCRERQSHKVTRSLMAKGACTHEALAGGASKVASERRSEQPNAAGPGSDSECTFSTKLCAQADNR